MRSRSTCISDCNVAHVRPRFSSSTSRPSKVYPVTQATPENAPITSAPSTTSTRLWTIAVNASVNPDAVIATPNSRRLDSRRKNFGPRNMPTARPTNTDPNIAPYAGSPPPRSSVYRFASPTTTPAAANAPSMPTTRPRTTFVWPMNCQPSAIARITLGCEIGTTSPATPFSSSARRRRPPWWETSRRVKIVPADTRNVDASKYRARSIRFVVKNGNA